MMPLSDTHQCQPSLSKPRPMVSPRMPRGKGGAGRRVRGVAGGACHTHFAIVLIVVGLQLPIADRPIVSHAVKGFHTEVGGMESWPMGRIVNAAAPYGVEHYDRRWVSSGLHHRVILR